MHAITHTINTHRKVLIISMLALIGVLFVLYVFLVNQIVHNVVARKKIEHTLAHTTSHIATLEATYLAHTQTITIEEAHARGFVSPEEYVFVSRTQPATSLTLNTEN